MTTVSKAVDVGCGTGVATVQIAGMFPSAKVYGLDISPVPEAVQKMAPANAAWAVGNILDVDYNKPGDDVMSREIEVTIQAVCVIFPPISCNEEIFGSFSGCGKRESGFS